MIKQWMEFCHALSQDAKTTAETIADALAANRILLADTFYKLACELPRKEAYTVFLHRPGHNGTPIRCYQAYTMTEAKIQALCDWPGFEILGIAQGDITVLEWNDARTL